MLQHLKQEAENMMKKIDLLEAAKRLIFLISIHVDKLFTFSVYFHSLTKEEHVALVISLPQEVLGGRFGGLLH